MKKEIAAIICTHNRASYLRKSLASLVCQSLPKERFEVIVVDNCSTDTTRNVSEEFRNLLSLKYVYEQSLGVSHARNTGWKNTGCQFVAYLDDDVIVSPEWLERILVWFKNFNPPPAMVGGKILLLWEKEKPDWITPEMEKYLGSVDWIENPSFLGDEGFYLAGGNVAYNRKLLQSQHGFSGSLGRKGRNLLSNEELLLQERVQREGLGIFYAPDIVVQHHVTPERLTKRWFYKRFYWQGASDAILEEHLRPGRNLPFLIARSLLSLGEAILNLARAEARRSNERMAMKCRLFQCFGRLVFDTRLAFRGTVHTENDC